MKSEREQQLEEIVRSTLWLARRYADGRGTHVTDSYNQACAKAIELGLVTEKALDKVTADKAVEATVWAKDAHFGWPKSLINLHKLHKEKNNG